MEDERHIFGTPWHEFRTYLTFAAHGIQPYHTFHSSTRRVDWSNGNPARSSRTRDGTPTAIFESKDSPLLPWTEEMFKIHEVRAFRLHVETVDGIRKSDFPSRPRWPSMETEAGQPTPTNPREFVWVDIAHRIRFTERSPFPSLLFEPSDSPS